MCHKACSGGRKELCSGTCQRTDTDSESDEENFSAKRQRTSRHQTKRGGGAHDGGQQFEIKTAAVIVLRGMQMGHKFELATNVKDTGNFDDLVYTMNDRRYYLQLKHTENANAYKLQPSELAKLLHQCFKTYLNIQDKDKSKFIFYTNKRLGPNLSDHNRQKAGDDTVEKVFETCDKGEIFNFIRDSNTDIDVYTSVEKLVKKSAEFCNLSSSEQKSKLKMLTKFLNKLIMVTGQKGQDELDAIIIEELRKHDVVKVGPEMYERELLYFKTPLETWWRNKKEIMTSEMFRSWLQNAKTKSCLSVVRSLFNSTKNLVMTNICFSADEIARFRKELSNKSAVHLTLDALPLCSNLLLDCLPQSKCNFVNFECLQSQRDELLHAWLGGVWEWLIVSCDAKVGERHISETCLEISEIIKQAPLNKCVIILSECSVQHVGDFVPINHKFDFEQLSKESQEMVLDKKIDFQGCEVTMRSVLQRHGNVQHVLGPELVTDLVTGGTAVNIGGKLHVNTGYYAPRVLQREVWLHSTVLRNPNDVFAVSGATKEEVLKIVPSGEIVEAISLKEINIANVTEDISSRIILLGDRDEENFFLAICEKLKGKPLHWVEFNNGHLLWKMSQDCTDSLLDYIIAEKTRADKRTVREWMKNGRCEVKEALIWDSGERTVLVVAEPGMGKSSTTTQVARHTKERDPTSWVVRINWNDHTGKLRDINAATFNFSSLVDFLCRVAFPDSASADVNRSLLKQALQSSGNVTVLMDGFDEISPTYADKAAAILSALMSTKLAGLWLTSRPVEKERLEKELSVIAYGMKKLSRKSQADMLFILWNLTAGEEELLEFTNDLLSHLNPSFYDDDFTGCPLYITMIATVYETEVETCLKSKVKIRPRYEFVNLYQKFFETKLRIYLKDKKKADITNPNVLEDHEILKEVLFFNFEKCALAAILPPSLLESLHNKNIEEEIRAFLGKVQAGKDKTGIVVNVVDGKPLFVHRTFAEYFAARWFSENFQSNRSVLEHILFDPNYRFVTYMFDRIVARGCPLHCAVLERDKESFETLLSEESVVSAVDKGGRNLMHIIATPRVRREELRVLDLPLSVWQHAVSLDTTDCVLQWTPLQYAIKSQDWFVLIQLLENGVDRSGLDMIRRRADDPVYIGQIMLHALGCGSFPLLEFLSSIGVNINRATFIRFPSPLCIAIRSKFTPVVRLLIKHGADCNTRDRDGLTPLIYAVNHPSVDIVQALVEEGGASLDVRDDCGRTVIDWAKERASDIKNHDSILLKDEVERLNEIVKYLRESGCKESGTARQNNDT